MEDAKQKLLTRIQESNNVLVTVSANPSLDQLAGAVGMTLLLNKLGKHATAVFSGKIPSSIEYLKPEQTLERDTNSLRDFIISLDKAKADKLRYKVEDKVVKIFITPYRTSLSEKDLEFSQGDFNVDLVIAVGVKEAKDLDQAIVSHGRILHDATVSSVNNTNNGQLGTINWINTKASSLCEMLYDLCRDLKADAVDPQMATAFLTGIVAETKRFSNEKTSAKTLDMSGQLVASGANQQLVAARLEIKPNNDMDEGFDSDKGVSLKKEDPKKSEDGSKGTLEINHTLADIESDLAKKREEGEEDDIAIDEHGNLRRLDQLPEPQNDEAGDDKGDNEPAAQALPDVPPADGISKFAPPKTVHLPPLNSNLSAPQADVPDPSLYPTTPEPAQDKPDEEPVSTLGTTATPDLSAARDAVNDAMSASPSDGPLPPRIDLNANPALEFNHPDANPPPAPLPDLPPNLQPMAPPQPASPPPMQPTSPAPEPPAPSAFPADLLAAVPTPTDNSGAPGASPLAPPPVPPPLMPTDFGSAPASGGQPSSQPLTPLNPPQPPTPPFPPAPQP